MGKTKDRITGKPLKQPRAKISIPVGVEKVLYKAAIDPAFRGRLLEDRMKAIESEDMKLRPSEMMVMRNVKGSALRKMIERIRPQQHGGKRIMKAVATAVLTLATGTAGVACDDGETGSKDAVDYDRDDMMVGGAMPDIPDILVDDGGIPDLEDDQEESAEEALEDPGQEAEDGDMLEEAPEDAAGDPDADADDVDGVDEADGGDAVEDTDADADDALEDPPEDTGTEE